MEPLWTTLGVVAFVVLALWLSRRMERCQRRRADDFDLHSRREARVRQASRK
jgi:hypothetical protein